MLFDYSRLDAAGVREDTDRSLVEAEALVDALVAPDAPPTRSGVLGTIDRIDDLIARTYGRTAFMGYVHPDPEVREVGREVEERLQKWTVEVIFRDDVYAAVRRFADSPEAAALEGEWARHLEFVMRDLRKAGHELDSEKRDEVRRLTQRLVELGVAFERNIAEDRSVLLVNEAGMEGLPEAYRDGLARGEEGGTYLITMNYPDVLPFMQSARRRDLRRQLAFKFESRAVQPNRPILEEAVALRERIAELFGQDSWARHQLGERMAKNPEAVEAFYAAIVPPLTERAQKELQVLGSLLEEDEQDTTVQVWDWRYYDNRLRMRDYGIDQDEVAEYFPLQEVVQGMLDLTGEVFGLAYRPVEAPTWHPDVTTHQIIDRSSGEPLAHFYMDLHPRDGKFTHAAAWPLVPGHRREDGSYQHPVSAIVANFTKPAGGRPSLLKHQEVETVFHEFGHVLHQTLTRAQLARFAGSSTETDFVEAPSQIMENWTWEAPVLQRFARHHRTGEPIPAELVERLVAARRLDICLTTLRQVQFGRLDLDLHGPGSGKDLDLLVRRACSLTLLPFHEGTFFPASFGHLFGYDAGYYGYLWAEVFGDDMWSRFADEGVTSPEVGMAYRQEILEKGGTADGGDLLRSFLGREPSNRAFLEKLGIG